MRCDSILFSGHALIRMFERGVNKNTVIAAVTRGETVVNYSDDRPYPSRLLLYFDNSTPIHVVVARDKKDYACYVITAYIPDPRLWSADFKTRIQ